MPVEFVPARKGLTTATSLSCVFSSPTYEITYAFVDSSSMLSKVTSSSETSCTDVANEWLLSRVGSLMLHQQALTREVRATASELAEGHFLLTC